MKLITRKVINSNKLDSLTLFKRNFKDWLDPHTKNGYMSPLFVKMTGISFPVRDKTFTNLLEIDKEIKREAKQAVEHESKLRTVEFVLNELESDISKGHHKTHLRETMHKKFDVVMEI